MPIDFSDVKPQLIAGPPCPACGLAMVERVAKKGPRTGQKFWGCVQFGSGTCKGTLPWEVGCQVLQKMRGDAEKNAETKAMVPLVKDDLGFLAFIDAEEEVQEKPAHGFTPATPAEKAAMLEDELPEPMPDVQKPGVKPADTKPADGFERGDDDYIMDLFS